MNVALDLTTPLGVVLTEMDAVLEHPVDLLVVGAEARDIIASQLSPDLRLVATTDVDLVLAVDDWRQYDETFAALTSFGSRGMMFTIAGVRVDIIPFGAVEDPPGTIRPPWMDEPFRVGALRPVFDAATPMTLPEAWRLTCRVPTVAGFAALKLHAWLERSAQGETLQRCSAHGSLPSSTRSGATIRRRAWLDCCRLAGFASRPGWATNRKRVSCSHASRKDSPTAEVSIRLCLDRRSL